MYQNVVLTVVYVPERGPDCLTGDGKGALKAASRAKARGDMGALASVATRRRGLPFTSEGLPLGGRAF